MTTERTVYAVASGAYSDYSIDCLFETEELAEQYATRRWGESRNWYARLHGEPEREYSVEEWRAAEEQDKLGYDVPYVQHFQLWPVLPVVEKSEAA